MKIFLMYVFVIYVLVSLMTVFNLFNIAICFLLLNYFACTMHVYPGSIAEKENQPSWFNTQCLCQKNCTVL